jgi:PTS system ascorbate-specific IIA component
VIGILLVTHNGLGESLVDCVRHVLGGTPPNIRVLPVLADDDPQQKEAEARALIARLDTGEGVLLLADLFGSTPSNIARRLRQPGRVEGLAGVNLPMLLRAVSHSARPLAEVAQKALESGRGCILSLDSDRESCDVATGCADH